MTISEEWRGKIGRLDAEELRAFLEEPIIARLACLDLEGWPYVVPCWHEWDGHGWWVIPRERSAWARYLEHDPRCAISIDEDVRQRKVTAQCTAELIETPNVGGRWVEIAERMSLRYAGEHGIDYFEPTRNKPRWLFHLRPNVLSTWQGIEWARRYR
jgi:hypothetical protein